MRRGSVDRWTAGSVAVVGSLLTTACDPSSQVGHWAIVVLKVVAGLVVAVVVFLPLMASLATIRAAVRRFLRSRDRNGR